MKKVIKDNWKFLLFVLIGGLIGGYFTGLYLYDSLSGEILKQIQEQNVTKEMLAIASMIQYGILYGLILTFIGILLSKKVKLWKEFKLNKKTIITTAIITIISALVLFPGDKLIFGTFNTWVGEQYMVKPTIYKIIAGLLAGGIIEEVMMRLFLMSLVVFIFSKLFYKNNKEIPVKVYILANIICALIFAVGHIPSTAIMTEITPLIVIRCLLFNGGLGLCFGYLYRKYGIGYAMISHGLCHLISDILMIIFI
ncbi:MAG: CPBP family intramembrane metalloprotease [Bacilli bacterium]|nr:CPBP family intramembrane metalloprotease [Bacilli bacterium]